MAGELDDVTTWRTLWKKEHKIYPWFVSKDEDEADALQDRVAQFFEKLIQPMLDEGKPVNLLVSIRIWGELVEQKTIGDYLKPTTPEMQRDTGKLGAIDNITFWTDAYTDQKAKDEQGNPLDNAFAILFSPSLEITEMNEQNKATAVPAIAEMLDANQEINSINDLIGQVNGVDGDSSEEDILAPKVSFIFGKKGEYSEERALLNDHLDSINWSDWLTEVGSKDKTSDYAVSATFKANSIAGSYDRLTDAVNAMIEEGEVKVVIKEGDEAKKTLKFTVDRASICASLSRNYDPGQSVQIIVRGYLIDKE